MKLLRADQVAKRLNISRSYAYTLMERGVFGEVLMLGERAKRVKEEEVERVKALGIKEEAPAQDEQGQGGQYR